MKNLRRCLFAFRSCCFYFAALLFFPCLVDAQGSAITRIVNRNLHHDRSTGILHLDSAAGAGIAWLGQEFTHGILEFDVRGKDEFQQSFVGFAFHGLDDTTYEAVYFRPFNFRSTDPNRKAHAIQYIANPLYDWPTLREQFPNLYEKPVPETIDPEDWFHVRIEITSEWITVTLNGGESPVLQIKPLVQSGGKALGYWVGNGSAGDWKNLRITAAE